MVIIPFLLKPFIAKVSVLPVDIIYYDRHSKSLKPAVFSIRTFAAAKIIRFFKEQKYLFWNNK
jgi:hypothetical protein